MKTRSLVAVLMSISLSAFAQTPPAEAGPGGGHHFKECKADAEKLCSGIERGGGRIISCLKSHESELSDGCKQQMLQHAGGHHHRGAGSPATGTAPTP